MPISIFSNGETTDEKSLACSPLTAPNAFPTLHEAFPGERLVLQRTLLDYSVKQDGFRSVVSDDFPKT